MAAPKKSSKVTHHLSADDWAEPTVIDDLAVDSRKVEDLKTWLLKFKNKCGVLLLTGPTGCGKTVTVRCLAKALGFHLREWITPLDRDVNNDAEFLRPESQIQKFEDFLYSCSRYRSLFSNSATSSSVLLVEDYPNVFLRNCEAFHEVLMRYCTNAHSPIVFICSDVADKGLKLSSDLFPAHIQLKLGISQLKLNPITRTRMVNALKRMVPLLHKLNPSFKPPTPKVISEVCDGANGDVRYATLLLQTKPQEDTAALFDMAIKSKLHRKGHNKLKGHIQEDVAIATCEKDDRVDLLHAVGRVLNPKWRSVSDNRQRHMSKNKKVTEDRQLNATIAGAELVHNPVTIVDSFLSTASKFLSFIHENYVNTFSTIDSVASAASCLSLAEMLMTEESYETNHEVSLDLGVRGVMIYNKAPIRAWNPIKRSRDSEVSRIQKEMLHMAEALFPLYSVNLTTLMMDYVPFMSHLNPAYLSHGQRQFVENCSSMEPLSKFCDSFKGFCHVPEQKSTKHSIASSPVVDSQKALTATTDDDFHISEDDSDLELDEGSQNLSMLAAALQEEQNHGQDFRELLNDEADIFLSQL